MLVVGPQAQEAAARQRNNNLMWGGLAGVALIGVAFYAMSGSSRGSEGDKQQARDAGFDHHLTKPVDPATVMRLLAA